MTRDEVIHLSAGPKLNDCVGMYVMGWSPETDDNDQGIWKDESLQYVCHQHQWRPSECPIDAFQVLDEMNHDQKHIVWHQDEKKWHVILGYGTWGRWYGKGETIMEAICKAALKYEFKMEGML